MNKNTNHIIPGDIFHPGIILLEEIEAKNLKPIALAKKMGVTRSAVSHVLNGKRNITPLIAVKLEAALEIPADFWMRLQYNFDIDSIRQQQKEI